MKLWLEYYIIIINNTVFNEFTPWQMCDNHNTQYLYFS